MASANRTESTCGSHESPWKINSCVHFPVITRSLWTILASIVLMHEIRCCKKPGADETNRRKTIKKILVLTYWAGFGELDCQTHSEWNSLNFRG